MLPRYYYLYCCFITKRIRLFLGTYSLPDIERDLATGVTDGNLQKFYFKTKCLSPLLFASCKKYVEIVFLTKYMLSGSLLQAL